jgi:hypothetical protein
MQVPSLLLAAGLALATAACGSDSSEPNPRTPLECEARDYPCALSEVSLAVLERGDALGDEALAMLEAGASSADAAAFLESQSDVAEVMWDDAVIWFRPTDGVGTWILREAAFAPEVTDQGIGGRSPSGPRHDGSPGRVPEMDIVGPESEEKRALVLSPFHWHVPDIEDTPQVAAILAGTRGYEGRVTHLSNQEETSTTVGLEHFMNWDEYDVVHVSTHGARVCSGGSCRGTLVAGLLVAVLPPGPGSKAEKLKSLETQGVSYAKSERTGREYLVLTADFFRHHYPDGLDDALVYLNSCESFGPEATDVVDAIRGESSVVFGWSETVRVVDATAAAIAMYQALSKGYPAEVALEEIGELAVGHPTEGSPSPELRESPRGDGGDLRIREVIRLLHLITGEELTAADAVPIEGTMGDGEPDAVPWLVQVDGVKPELAGGMTVRVLVAGAQSDPVPLEEGQANEEDQWTLSGLVLLDFDLTEETPVTFGARVELHEGGVSEHETPATLSGEEPIMGRVWEMEAVHTEGWFDGTPHTPYGSTTRLTLTFAPGQSATEPHPRYVITGGTVTFDYNQSYFDCISTAPVLTFDVTEDVSRDSRLLFDTTTDPVGYHGVLFTYGPEFTVTTSCGGRDPSTRTHRATTTWLLLEADEARSVSADRRRIEGTYRVEASVGSYIETNYVITRMQ